MLKFKKIIGISCAFSCLLSLSLEAQVPTETPKGYALSENEEMVLKNVLNNEKETFINGGEGILFGRKMPLIDAQQAAKDYDENQVAADQKYFDKKLQVNGVIVSINSGIGNAPYILLKGKNPFLSPQIHFSVPNINKISALKKEQNASFLCVGAGAVAGTPMFKECIFTEDYADQKIEDVKVKVKLYLQGETPKSDVVPKITILSILVSRTLPKNSSCFSDGKKCESEMNALNPNKESIKQVALELKSKGVFMPEELIK